MTGTVRFVESRITFSVTLREQPFREHEEPTVHLSTSIIARNAVYCSD